MEEKIFKVNYIKRAKGYWVKNIIIYLVMISFLFPRGYAEYNSIYKTIQTSLIWLSTLIIWIQFFIVFFKKTTHKSMRKEELYIISYFVFLIIITLLLRGLHINGYQKLIAYPSIMLFIIFNFRKNPKILLNSIINIILIIFFLQPILLRNEEHITFLGHVQMVAQIGILGIFCSLLYYKMYHEHKIKIIISIILITVIMLITDASSSKLSCGILILFGFLYCIKKYKFLTLNSKTYIILGGIISAIVVIMSIVNNLEWHSAVKFLDFSGRGVVWKEVLPKVANSPIYGYGIEGVLIDVFWNKYYNSEGFNYAHNQNLQNLLDGGIITLILFYLMMIGCFKNVKQISDKKYQALINAILICFAFIMIFESTTLYYYMYIYLAIVYSLPRVIKEAGNEEKNELNK